ncbi:MAG TPA: protein kinase, partial [Myxococcaceae bacterium]|nr:protein kinase [Myxococcaceae bacterium]
MATVRYQPLSPLLSGEGSRAFLGLEIVDGTQARPVVLIWVPEGIADDGEQMGRLARDTHRATLLDHPHLVRVLGLAALDEGMIRVVEYLDGESLRRVLDSVERLPPPLAARVCADAAQGVHYAHEAGNDDGTPLVHGDIRPETVFVTFSGVAKVGGYGALAVAPKEHSGQRLRGRRLYSTPEQLLGGRDTINRQTDVYLLGALLHRCLTGKAPFEGVEGFDTAVISSPLPAWDEGLAPELRVV